MTLDEAIKDLEHGTKQLEMEIESGLWIKGSESELCCKEGIALNKQHIEWLTELKDLREENKVLTSECDRLIKEKGELLSKVSGGDVLKICQLEEQLKHWKEEYANLNKISYGFYKELKEAKRLLKAAVEDMHIEDMCDVCVERIPNSPIHCPDGSNCFVWRYKDEVLKLIES